jgi:16S rRNA processing protein RimM
LPADRPGDGAPAAEPGDGRSERLEIGGIARAHGIRGEVAIFTHDPDSTILETVTSIFIGGTVYEITGARDTPKEWLVALAGITTRTEAEALRGKPVEVSRDALELTDDDILLHDLVGCRVVLADGTPWGVIFAIDAGGTQDRLVIHDGEIERLLPLVDQFVTGIDLDARVVTVDPPEGLPESKR